MFGVGNPLQTDQDRLLLLTHTDSQRNFLYHMQSNYKKKKKRKQEHKIDFK